MGKILLSLVLIASFGFLLTIQSPILLKTSSGITELNDDMFLNAEVLADKITKHYERNPEEIPNNVYIFTVAIAEPAFANKPQLIVDHIRNLDATKRVFGNSPNRYMTNYLGYQRASEVKNHLIDGLKRLSQHFQVIPSEFFNFKGVANDAKRPTKYVIDDITVPFTQIQALDRFLIQKEQDLAKESAGKYLLIVLVDNVQVSPRRNALILAEVGADGDNNTAEQTNQGTTDAAGENGDTNTKNTSTDLKDDTDTYQVPISAQGFTAIAIALFITFVIYIGTSHLAAIQSPTGFVAQPLHVGKEH